MAGPRDYLDSTLKELFALSGNQCAYPGCLSPLIDDYGNVVGQIAHIHGVRPKSARYDPGIEASRLRQSENLVVLCYDHHVATDDVTLFPPARMYEIKKAHERRFGGVIAGLRATVEDQTTHSVLRPPRDYGKYRAAFGLSDGEAEQARAAVVSAVQNLARLPPDARSVLAVVVDRGDTAGEGICELPVGELRRILGLDDHELGELNNILIRNGYVQIDTDTEWRGDYYRGDPWVVTRGVFPGANGAPFVLDVLWARDELGVAVRTLIVDLDWRVTDS
jgi:hypothetical protein